MNQAIAQELGSSREVVSRIFKTFEKQELLSLSRGKQEKNLGGYRLLLSFSAHNP